MIDEGVYTRSGETLAGVYAAALDATYARSVPGTWYLSFREFCQQKCSTQIEDCQKGANISCTLLFSAVSIPRQLRNTV